MCFGEWCSHVLYRKQHFTWTLADLSVRLGSLMQFCTFVDIESLSYGNRFWGLKENCTHSHTTIRQMLCMKNSRKAREWSPDSWTGILKNIAWESTRAESFLVLWWVEGRGANAMLQKVTEGISCLFAWDSPLRTTYTIQDLKWLRDIRTNFQWICADLSCSTIMTTQTQLSLLNADGQPGIVVPSLPPTHW